MKVLSKVIWLGFMVIILHSCKNNEIEVPETMKIQFGSECGWCAGREYITLTSSKINYERNIPCDENKGTTNKNKALNSTEWNSILASFDYERFKMLEYAECNVCVDGCDEIIKITEDNYTHELRYTPSEEVEGMGDLREILNNLMDEMRDMN